MKSIQAKGSDGLINDKELARRIDVTTRTIKNWRDQGIIPFLRIGRRIRFREESIRKLLDKLEVGGGK